MSFSVGLSLSFNSLSLTVIYSIAPSVLLSTINCIFFAINFGASTQTRTGTPLLARDFKSLVSTYFTKRATGFSLLDVIQLVLQLLNDSIQ